VRVKTLDRQDKHLRERHQNLQQQSITQALQGPAAGHPRRRTSPKWTGSRPHTKHDEPAQLPYFVAGSPDIYTSLVLTVTRAFQNSRELSKTAAHWCCCTATRTPMRSRAGSQSSSLLLM